MKLIKKFTSSSTSKKIRILKSMTPENIEKKRNCKEFLDNILYFLYQHRILLKSFLSYSIFRSLFFVK